MASDNTSVTGTITDPSGRPYANAQVNATLVLPAATQLATLSGSPIAQKCFTCYADASGVLTLVLPDNSKITPPSSTYTFSVIASDGVTVFSVASVTISGTTQDIGATLTASALQLTDSAGVEVSIGSQKDCILVRDGADTIAQKRGNNDQLRRIYASNGGYWEKGCASELVTIAAAATTDTTASLLPANSIIEAVVLRVTVVIPTAATFTVGDATTAARFATGVLVAATTTAVGLLHQAGGISTDAAGPTQTAAAKIRITPNATPGAATGKVRVTVFYSRFVAPTS